MKSFLPSRLIVLAVFVLTAGSAFAQNKIPREKTMRKKPVWIDMMRDTSANFYETVKAFRLYYKEHYLPREPGEIEKNDAFERLVGLIDDPGGMPSETASEREEKRRSLAGEGGQYRYAAEVRSFRGWYFNNAPWVRADGSVIGPLERQQLVDRQQAEQRNIEAASPVKKDNE